MHLGRTTALAAFLATGALAVSGQQSPGQHPFVGPDTSQPPLPDSLATAECPPEGPVIKRIAIVGAGASGASAALWLSTAQTKLDDLWAKGLRECPAVLDVTIFERTELVGGRTRIVHPYGNQSYPPVELGASIFADVNPNMVRFSERYKLNATARLGEPDSTTSIWNGESFIFEDLSEGWWSSAKMFWRYGYSPARVSKYVASLVASYLKQYDPLWVHSPSTLTGNQPPWPWRSPESVISVLGFVPLVATNALDRLYNIVGASKLFLEELVEAATRVNYGQNVDAIHALGAGVSLAATGARGIEGGNFHVFEQMIGESGARLRLGDHGAVSGIIKFASLSDAMHAASNGAHALSATALAQAAGDAAVGGWAAGHHKWYVGTTSNYGAFFDAVIVAAPWHNANIRVVGAGQAVPRTKYVRLHVTLLVTNASEPSGEYFGKGTGSSVSRTILTALGAAKGRAQSKAHSSGPVFNSLNYLRSVQSPNSTGSSAEEHVIKIFSPHKMDDDKLAQLFGRAENVRWVYRHVWEAYPCKSQPPFSSLNALLTGLHHCTDLQPTRRLPPLEVDKGLLYPNSFEPVLSTMETSTLSSRNAVGLLLLDWFGPEFVHGTEHEGCPPSEQSKSSGTFQKEPPLEVDWAGWGCHSA